MMSRLRLQCLLCLGAGAGGALSRHIGSAKTALMALAGSLSCALLFVLFWRNLPVTVLLPLMLVWGATVVADSPQFSTLAASHGPQTNEAQKWASPSTQASPAINPRLTVPVFPQHE